MKKKAFTLAETLICLGFIGIIATTLVTVTSKNLPDQNKILFKKAYATTSHIVTELVNDESLYPYIDHNNPAHANDSCVTRNTGYYRCKGLRNVERAVIPGSSGCRNTVREGITHTNLVDKQGINACYYTTSGDLKFLDLFASKLNLNNPPAQASQDELLFESPTDLTDRYQFTTSDGVTWELPSYRFNNAVPAVLAIDTNGINKGPNCHDDGDENNPCPEPDRFWINIHYDGSVNLGSESQHPKEYEYLQDESLLKNNN